MFLQQMPVQLHFKEGTFFCFCLKNIIPLAYRKFPVIFLRAHLDRFFFVPHPGKQESVNKRLFLLV